MLFSYSIHQRILKNDPQKAGSTKILSCTTYFNISILVISEGSCDTEDWSKEAVNSALPSQK